MKKVVILSLVCVLLCACAAGSAAPDLSGADFTADIAFSLGGRDYAATYTKAAGTATLVFGAPESLCGTVDGREYDIQVLRFVRMERSDPQ